jgi:CHAD domain-containing protein
MKSYRPLWDRDATDHLRAELKWLADVLGKVRDAEVMAARLDRALGELPPEQVVGPVANRLTGGLRAQASRTTSAWSARSTAGRYAALLDELDALLAAAPTTRGCGRPRSSCRAGSGARSARFEQLLDTAEHGSAGGPPLPGVLDRDTALHEARKAAKQARYAAEARYRSAAPAATALAAAMEELQELLGDHHDSVVTRQLLRTAGMQAHGAGENGFTYGMLSAAETAAAQDIEARLPAARKELRRKKVVGWLER